MVQYELIDTEVRVLGCLIEKDMATPEYYPLSLNALINACNQKSNRSPVVSYDEETVLEALNELKEKQLVYQSNAGRVNKYAHNLDKKHNLIPKELSLIGLLLIRGQQTPGELRGRSERLCSFQDLDKLTEILNHLIEIGFAQKMPRLPGRKEARYAHLLSGIPQTTDAEQDFTKEKHTIVVQRKNEKIEELEDTVQLLKQDIEALRKEFSLFKKEFE